MTPVRLSLAAVLLAAAVSAHGGEGSAAPATAAAPVPAKTAEKVPAAPETLSADGLPSDWIQCVPVRAFEPGKLYVFEFWATWCGPCLAMIPHMNEIYGKFKDSKDVVIVGVNVYDKTPVAKLSDFLAKRPVRPDYAIAADRGALATEKNWLKPLGVSGIPFAVALKDGKILWKGHPQGLSAELVGRMAKPGYSPAEEDAARAAADAARKERARQVREVRQLLKDGKNAEADALIGRIVAAPAADADTRAAVLETPFMPRLLAGDPAGAQQALRRMAETLKDDRYAQVRAAHCILSTDELAVKDKDLKLAIACLERAQTLAGKPEAFLLERIADARSMMGDAAGAAAAQEQAVRCLSAARALAKLEGDAALDAFLVSLPAVPAPRPEPVAESAAPPPAAKAASPAVTDSETAPPAVGGTLDAGGFARLEWLQGPAVGAWEPGKLHLIDLWIPPAPGPAGFDQKTRGPLGQAKKRLGKLLEDPAFRPAVVVVFGSPEVRARAVEVLRRPAFRTPHPVALDDGTVMGWMEALNIRSLPACLLVKDGRLLWAGEAGDLDPETVGAMLRPDYDPAKAAARKEAAKAQWKRLKDAMELAKARKFDEAEAAYKELTAAPDGSAGLRMMAYEGCFGIAFQRGGAAAGLAVLQEALDRQPENGFVAERVFKYVTGTEALKDAGRPLAIRAATAMAAAHADDPDYAAACWGSCVGPLREEGGDKAGAGEAYRKGLAVSSACRRLQELRAAVGQAPAK